MFVAFEGLDGAGKSTNARLLQRWLARQGECVLTDWNSSPIVAPAIKRAKKQRALTPVSYSLLHAADFADRHERIIRPALDSGKSVIADRYLWTALARDTVRGCDHNWVASIYAFAIRPDITFYLRVAPEIALARKDRAPKYYESGRDVYPRCDAYEAFCLYQRRIVAAYEEMADEFVVIDGTLSPRKQQRAIRQAVLERMGRRLQRVA